MSSFTVPIADPGSPQYISFPNSIRASAMEGLLQRDRFIVATSRRCLASFGYRALGNIAFTNPFRITTRTSPTFSGNIDIVVFGGAGYEIEVIAGVTFTLGTIGAQSVIAGNTGWGPGAADQQITLRVRKTGVANSYIEGVYIIETALVEKELP